MKVVTLAVVLVGITAPAGQAYGGGITCFRAFNQSVEFQFHISSDLLKNSETRHISGRLFGNLVPCGGLNEWPLIGTKLANTSRIILGFRAMTVDAQECGAVDFLFELDTERLFGQLQLHNDRRDFSNTSPVTPFACTSPVSVTSATAATAPSASNVRKGILQRDVAGNRIP